MTKQRDRILSILIPISIYFLSIGIYLHPLTSAPTPSNSPNNKKPWKLIYDPKPQMDELHIMTKEHHDVNPQPTTTNTWTEAWVNDYWGRPLTFESSHKSWRPISIWSFRFGKGGKFGRWLIGIVGISVGAFMEGMLGTFGGGFTSGDETYMGEGEGAQLASVLFVHRFVNVFIHAAIVQMIGAVASLLFSGGLSSSSSSNRKQRNLQLYTKYFSQILFALHPVHVEAVANAANRPHILALLFNATIVDPNVPLIAMAILATAGLLTAETAIFQFPAIVLTMTAIRYREFSNKEKRKSRAVAWDQSAREEDNKPSPPQKSPIEKTFITLLPRYVLLVLISATYLLYRHYNDSLSIPSGLIRPAENPFYDKLDTHQWTLAKRMMNYSYILSLHIMKSFGVEIVGFSHEYGFDCIPEMQSILDYRLLLPTALAFLFGFIVIWSVHGWRTSSQGIESSTRRYREQEERIQRLLLVLVFLSWMATLFPIAGILKVGTFVADRIAVASSFGTCIFAGRFFAVWIIGGGDKNAAGHTEEERPNNTSGRKNITAHKILILIYLCVNELGKRTHNRAAQWMDSAPLLESSLRACPRSIKSNLEMSKIYSGLVPHMLDLEKSLSLISTAQSIDPAFCDVHQQYAHVYFQQSKYIPFEEEMVKSLLCQFTSGQAMNNWNRYWKVVLNDGKNIQARKRYEKYVKEIEEAVVSIKEKEENGERSSSSHGGVKEEL